MGDKDVCLENWVSHFYKNKVLSIRNCLSYWKTYMDKTGFLIHRMLCSPTSTKRRRAEDNETKGRADRELPTKRARKTDGAETPKRPRPTPDEGEAEGIRRGGSRRAPFRDITIQVNRDDLDGIPEPDPEPQEEGKGVG